MSELIRLPYSKKIDMPLICHNHAVFPLPYYAQDNVVQSEKLSNDFIQEVKEYIIKYPRTQHVDIYLHDINGAVRGKRIVVDALFSLEQGCYFPVSIYAMDRDGKVIDYDHHNKAYEEPDQLCLPMNGTLRPCADDPQHHAQVLLTMKNPDGSPCLLEPKNILETVLSKLHQRGLYPVIAAELEFYLTDPTLEERRSCCLELDMPAVHRRFIEDIERAAHEQQLPLAGIVAEAEANQFELNLRHSNNVVSACEQVLALKRLTRTLAEKYGYNANFMAKPFMQLAGNGLHFHISLSGNNGENVFASPAEKPNRFMKQCLAGMLSLMPASIAIMAPNVNAYRRLRKSLEEPVFHSWGYNNRTAALRIPCSNDANRRIEYRLAGADANPYLVMATILTGMLYGLERCDEKTASSVCSQSMALPLFQRDAIECFRHCEYLTTSLGREFSQLWIACKKSELTSFESIVTQTEAAWQFTS